MRHWLIICFVTLYTFILASCQQVESPAANNTKKSKQVAQHVFKEALEVAKTRERQSDCKYDADDPNTK